MTQGESNSYQGGEAASYQATGGNNQQPYGYPKPDISQAARYAKQHAQDDDDDDDKEHIFTSVLSKLQTHDENPHLNETEAEHAAHAHEKVYNQNNTGQASSRDLGSAAAMQAFKMFSSSKSSNGGGSSNELVGLAMGEAMKLFKSQGGSSSGANQSEMLQQAAMMAMKLFMTQQTSGQGGSSSGGGLGQVMGILSSLNGASQPQQQQQPPKHSSGVSSLLSKFL